MGQFLARVRDHLILPARVRLTVGQQRLFQISARRVPTPRDIRFLIDTGSTRTTLTPEVIQHLEALEGRTVRVSTPLGEMTATYFWVRIEFPEATLAPVENIQVARLSMPPGLGQFQGLIGRDLLSHWDSLLYEGQRGYFTLRDRPGILRWLRRWT